MNTFNDAIEFANQHPNCFVATIDGDRPRVRGLRMWHADESGFHFVSHPHKNIIRQLFINPNIEVCFYKQGDVHSDAEMLRISGRARFLNDEHLEWQRVEGSDYEERWKEASKKQNMVIFKIIAGEAYIWKSSDGITGASTLLFDISDTAKDGRGPAGEAADSGARDFLSFREKDYSYHLDTKSIVYLTSSRKHSIIHTENRDYEVTLLLKSIKKMLPAHRFLRIQKQHIVNLAYIDRIEYLEGGRYIAYLNDNDDTVLPVGRNYVSLLKERIALRVSFIP
jgi:pyridoxamine 5'-phosphate oxidase